MSNSQIPNSPTSTERVYRFLDELSESKGRHAQTSARERISLAEACAEGVVRIAHQWVDAACRAKAIPETSPHRGEEVFAGPVAALRDLRLIVDSLRGIETTGTPQLPGRVYRGADGQLRVPLMPTRSLYDRLALFPFKVTAWMRDGVCEEDLQEHIATHFHALGPPPAKTIVVLGAGNVSAIPLTDTFSKVFHEGGVVLLKLSPVNEYLGPLFEDALRPLIDQGCLRIAYGGEEVGATAIHHHLVDEVHITGSIHSHDAIVWGPPGPEREKRKSAGTPVLEKPITSELGNVSPWILLPGDYSGHQLAFQANNVAASVVNNVSFNCVATKVLITWKRWGQRSRFLDLIDDAFARTPTRDSYYPGAMERYRRLIGTEPPGADPARLPWTLLRDVQPAENPQFFAEESFVCILVEVPLDAASPEAFFHAAVDFANQRLSGTLCAAVTHPPAFRSRRSHEQLLQSCLARLRYGAIAVNHWPGLMYAMMSPPWGGYPNGDLADAQSGIGWVHNTFMLEGVEKTVLEGPLTMVPKPPWFADHAHAERVAWSFFRLYQKPSWINMLRLLLASFRG